jgi:hypothetical protein
MSTLKRGGRLRSSLVRMHSPMSVAMLQCSTVGVNITLRAQRHNSSSNHAALAPGSTRFMRASDVVAGAVLLG